MHWLIEHQADLNRPDAPAFPIAARYTDPDMMRYLVQQNPKTQHIGYWNIEHQEYGDIASFKDFMDRPPPVQKQKAPSKRGFEALSA